MRLHPAVLLATLLACAGLAEAQVAISVDAAANQHPIDPRIYGIHFGSAATLNDLNATMNRYGGNSSGRYNWQQNVDNRGIDYFFESIPYADPTPGALGDAFILNTKNGGAEPFETLPMVDYIAKTDAGRNTLWSFSVALYGPQCSSNGDAGDGVHTDCATFVVNNNKDDASTLNNSAIQQAWAQHIKDTFGPASTTGLKYWGYDNEPSIWFSAYRDVTPLAKRDVDMLSKMIEYGSQIRATDPDVTLLGPEEWGWDAIFYSGYDQKTNADCGYCGNFPDHDLHGDYVPFLLDMLRQYETDNGVRLLDVYSQHFYPQGTEYYPDSNASDVPTQLLRNRSTRGLWDPNYLNESYINDYVQLIPRMRSLVNAHYPAIKIGLTEYNWGGDFIMNGATVQADILGILGREGADIGIRWDTNGFTPAMPPYQAFKLYRNYDGAHSTFGDIGVLASVPDADTVAAFAAKRSSDGALTVMVINKSLAGNPSATVNVSIAGFTPGPNAQAFQVAGAGTSITPLGSVPVAGNVLSATVPSPSVTLFVIPGAGAPTPSLSIADTSLAEGDAGTTNATFQVTLSAASASQVTVDYATADGSATAGSDYVATSGTLTITAGQTTGQILIPVIGDTNVEPDETFFVNLSAPSNATISDGQAVGTIMNDDTPMLWLSIADTSLPEGNAGTTNAQFQVTLSAASASPVTVDYATVDGSATAGSDYLATSGTLTITAGQTTGQILVPVIGDSNVEGDETFLVNLSAAAGAIIADGQAVGTIMNDDVPGPNLSIAGTTVGEAAGTALFVVTADAPAAAPITVDYATADGTAAAGYDYVAGSGTVTIPFGSSTITIPVTIIDDVLDEPDESFTVTLTGATGGTISSGTATGVIQDDDGGILTIPEITPGFALRRDFLLSSEQLFRMKQQPASSYEAVVDALSGDVLPIALDRLGPDYSVLSSAGPAGSGISRSLRFENALATPVSTELVRVRSGSCVNTCTADDGYRLRLYDTTYRIPRFNNSASQVTVLVLRNEADASVAGHVWAWGPSGSAVASQGFTIAAHGTFSLNTSTLAPGTSGSLTISSDGAYGQLAGKAVSVEPATGFTFDTSMEARPR
jgi:hypothetical protein